MRARHHAAILFIGLLSFVAAAFASEPSPNAETGQALIQFLDSVSGQTWTGGGSSKQLIANGSWKQTQYAIRIDFRAKADERWENRTELRYHSGPNEFVTSNFAVNGDLLLLQNTPYEPFEPVRVLEATPTKLSYSLQRVSANTGRLFLYTYRFELTDSDDINQPDVLKGFHTVELNGVIVSENRFEVMGW